MYSFALWFTNGSRKDVQDEQYERGLARCFELIEQLMVKRLRFHFLEARGLDGRLLKTFRSLTPLQRVYRKVHKPPVGKLPYVTEQKHDASGNRYSEVRVGRQVIGRYDHLEAGFHPKGVAIVFKNEADAVRAVIRARQVALKKEADHLNRLLHSLSVSEQPSTVSEAAPPALQAA